MTRENQHPPEDQSKEQLDADQQIQAAAEPELAAQTPEQVIADLNQKLAEMQDNYLRAKAEGENIRRRAVEDISKAHKFAIEGFAENLVPVTDSLYAALNAEAVDAKAFIDMWNSAIETLSLVHKVYVRTPPNIKFANGLWFASVRFSFGPKK